MKNIKSLSTQLKKIIDRNLNKNNNTFKIKKDGSYTSNIDLLIEEQLIKFIKSKYLNIKIISEEDPSTHKKKYKLGNKYCIIDPIDGTENFLCNNTMFGCAISLTYIDFHFDFLYIPSMDEVICNYNESLKIKKLKVPKIHLLSTKCLGGKFNNKSKYRILGSSSYMFYNLLKKKAYSYTYCNGAKIWDCYTGIRLANFFGLKIILNNPLTLDKWLTNPSHLTSFEIKWKK